MRIFNRLSNWCHNDVPVV